ncbi:hypothetical protein ACWGKW_15135 [Streptomyces sp. NPDC054766]
MLLVAAAGVTVLWLAAARRAEQMKASKIAYKPVGLAWAPSAA